MSAVDVEKAVLAYQDARTAPDSAIPLLIELADALAEDALELWDAHSGLEAEHDRLAARLDELIEDDGGPGALHQAVREEHDHNHPDGWAICGYAICRQAAREGQR